MKNYFLFLVLIVGSIVTAQNYNPVNDFVPNKNPNGVWSFGYGGVGGTFTQSSKMTQRASTSTWATNEGWKGTYITPKNGQSVTFSVGLIMNPGTLVLHPGIAKDNIAKLMFTAPADGVYAVNANFKNIDVQAKKTFAWVYSNASAETGTVYNFTPKGWKELFPLKDKPLVGHNATTKFEQKITMKKGEKITFEVGNGGDGYSDDAVELDLNIASVTSKNTLNVGETLKAGERLTSTNGKYILRMQEEDGNLCVYNFANGKQGGFVWGSMKYGFNNAKLLMQTDGNLVVYDGAGAAKWASNTHPYSNAKFRDPSKKPVKLVLENNGKLNLYSASGSVVWSSN